MIGVTKAAVNRGPVMPMSLIPCLYFRKYVFTLPASGDLFRITASPIKTTTLSPSASVLTRGEPDDLLRAKATTDSPTESRGEVKHVISRRARVSP